MCCAITNKDSRAGVSAKKALLRKGFAEKLRFVKAEVQGKAFTGCIPGEHAWSPVNAMAVPLSIACECLPNQRMGLQTRLLDDCMQHWKDGRGIVAICGSADKPLL